MYQDFDYCCRYPLFRCCCYCSGVAIVLLHALHFSSTHFPFPFCHILTAVPSPSTAPFPPPSKKTGLTYRSVREDASVCVYGATAFGVSAWMQAPWNGKAS